MMNEVWIDALDDILQNGVGVSPRGQNTLEIPQRTLEVDMRYPVLTVPSRKLSYQFMAAEAFWILSGDNRVSTISPYNKNISQFSDNGETFFGAYGPKIKDQISYVTEKLLKDPSSRQAGLTIWRENPPETKDVPCTVAMFFSIRDNELNCSTYMRSSDVWLGIPYDVFNFSMLSHLICGFLNVVGTGVQPGILRLTAASSHLYERNFEAAKECINQFDGDAMAQMYPTPTPTNLYCEPDDLMHVLRHLRESKSGDPERWWEHA